jgi:hypothetical protein
MTLHRLAPASLAFLALALATAAVAQPPAAPRPLPGTPALLRPGLLWKEGWRGFPGGAQKSVIQASIRNPDLDLTVLGPDPGLHGADAPLKVAGADGNDNNPSHLFSGECTTACGISLKNRRVMADLTGLARIRVDLKMSGLHRVYPLIKLANGDWLVGEQALGGHATRDWIWAEFDIAGMPWIKIDPATLLTHGAPTDKVDLTKVDEIGFMDPAPASGHGDGGWFDLGQIEVYAKPVPR